MRWIGSINLLLGCSALFAAAISIVIYAWDATTEPHRYLTLFIIFIVIAPVGMWNGWRLFRQHPAQPSTSVFALGLLCYVIVNGLFDGVLATESMALSGYAVLLLVLSWSIRPPEPTPAPEQPGRD